MKSEIANRLEFTVSLGVSSYENVVKLYENLKVLDPSGAAYVREKIAKESVLSNCATFLLLRPLE